MRCLRHASSRFKVAGLAPSLDGEFDKQLYLWL
jgi:hypothetical protein